MTSEHSHGVFIQRQRGELRGGIQVDGEGEETMSHSFRSAAAREHPEVEF